MVIAAELSGILFGVSAEKGQQLLLEPAIEKALNTRNIAEIRRLSETHSNAFWTVLNLHLLKVMNDLGKMQNCAYTVWNGLWESYWSKCGEFIRYLKIAYSVEGDWSFPTKNSVNDYVAVFSLLEIGGFDFSNIWKRMISSLNEEMKKGDFDHSTGNKILSDLAACQKRQKPSGYRLGKISVENWIKWATASNLGKFNSYNYVKPPETIISEISSKIVEGTPIPDRLYDLIVYLVNAGETSWEPMINAIQKHIQWNQGTQSGSVFSIDIFKILTLLSTKDQDILKFIEPIVKNGSFYNLAYHLRQQGSIKYTALLMARCFLENIDTIQIPNVANSANGLREARDFWKIKSDENAQFVWNELKPDSDFMIIWKLAEVENNALVGDIIRIAVKENCPSFFNYANTLQLFSAAISVTDRDGEEAFETELTRCFISNSQIEKEILEANELDIISYSYELILLIQTTENEKITKGLIERMNSVSREQWEKALREDTHLTTLAVAINEKSKGLNLANDLYEPLLSYLQSWISNSVAPKDLQQDKLPKLISMLKESFRTQLKDRLASHLVDIGFKGNPAAVSILLDFINIEKIVTEDKGKIQNAVEDSIRKSNIDSLKILDMILSHHDSSMFKPDKHLADIFKVPMSDLLTKDIDKALVERLAAKFGVDLSAPYNDNDERLEPKSGNE